MRGTLACDCARAPPVQPSMGQVNDASARLTVGDMAAAPPRMVMNSRRVIPFTSSTLSRCVEDISYRQSSHAAVRTMLRRNGRSHARIAVAHFAARIQWAKKLSLTTDVAEQLPIGVGNEQRPHPGPAQPRR